MFANALLQSPNYYLGISSGNIPFIDIDKKEGICRYNSDHFRSFIRWIKRLLNCRVAVIETDNGYHIIPLIELFNEMEYKDKLLGDASAFLSILKRTLMPYRETMTLASELTLDDVVNHTRKWTEIRRRAPPIVRQQIVKLARDIESIITTVRWFETVTLKQGGYIAKGNIKIPTFEEFYRILNRFISDTTLRRRYHVYVRRCVDKAFVELSLKYHRTTLRISGKPRKPYDLKLIRIL